MSFPKGETTTGDAEAERDAATLTKTTTPEHIRKEFIIVPASY